LKALDDGSITHAEALVARQAVDKMKNALPKYSFNNLRGMFDTVAKKISAGADKAYQRAVMSETLRLPLPVNKSGGTSIAKGFLGTLAGVVPALSMSPAIQGATATAVGSVGRQVFGKNIPAIRSVLSNLFKNREMKLNPPESKQEKSENKQTTKQSKPSRSLTGPMNIEANSNAPAPTASPLSRKAIAYYLKGENQKAATTALEAIQENPEDREAMGLLSGLSRKGDYGYKFEERVRRTLRRQ
jgi:hypothetical protein